MKLFFASALLLMSLCATAQKKVNFSSQNYAGLLEGEHGSSLQLQTINGLKFSNWFVGLGTGIDWYYRRSIPVFTSVNMDFLKKEKRSFYLSGNVGINFPWQMNDYYTSGDIMKQVPIRVFIGAQGLDIKLGWGKGVMLC
jgi:hypothetical protein